MKIEEALTYNDVLLVPRASNINSRNEIDTSSRISRNIKVAVPIISANMNSVTESQMAIAMAKGGAIGFIHRFMTLEKQAEEIQKVRRSEGFVLHKPYTVRPDTTLREIREKEEALNIKSYVVVDENDAVLGLITGQRTVFETDKNKKASEMMVKRKELVVASPNISFKKAKEIFRKNRISKLPLVDKTNTLKGLVTARSVIQFEKEPSATKDNVGRYMVGASVGVTGDYMERAEVSIAAGVNILVVDVAHGHNSNAIKAIKNIKKRWREVDLIGGNVATAEGTTDLIKAGVDGVKVGIGPGSLCSTRIVAGVGVPQFSAVLDCVRAAKKYKIPIIADGGINYPGDISKALGAGASAVMLGRLLSGTDESPGEIIMRKGQKYKALRGSASFLSVADRKLSLENSGAKLNTIVPEGVEALTPYKGAVKDVIYQMTGGLRSGMSYSNAKNIQSFWRNAKFVKITSAGWNESKPHDIEEI